ncbi:aldose 1-epimerase family protein [Ligilactobacillus agilis]|uniref:aldose 1-epimerase family protein n=1 Tax=Ligilactobacillus agilis TaxID=1601 RepID=UPI003D808704
MAVFLENDYLVATIKEHGAELASLRSKETGLEYIWTGDAKYWGRQAPVLFPIVGRLKDDQYQVAGKTYHLGQHGFARDRDFAIREQTATKVVLELTADEASKELYPFDFCLQLSYELTASGLVVGYRVDNPSQEPIYFGIGGHPAFKTPLTPKESFSDYELTFNADYRLPKIPLTNGLTDIESARLSAPTATISRELFKDDALIYDLEQKPAKVSLTSKTSGHGVSLSVTDAKFMGIWSTYPKEGQFVCLEPWWGLADTTDSDGDFTQKYAINRLDKATSFNHQYEIIVF